mgnify:CR=1 FL=1
MASSHVGGLSGAFIPVSEDEGMIAAASSGALTLDKLEAMTCVCSVGLDMLQSWVRFLVPLLKESVERLVLFLHIKII